MSDVQIYLLEADKNKSEARRIAAQSAAKLESKQLKLIDLITSLEEYINNKNDGGVRAKSVAYLADVLELVPQKVLSGQERRLLCDFILGRLEGDTEGVGACARTLIALETLGKWDTELAKRVMSTFLNYTHPLQQFRLQTERFPIIQLIDLLLAKYRTTMKALHDSDPGFMPGFVAYFDGEKDPRNLMIVFSLLQVPMTEWDIQAHAQDMFEAVFNYFPITFKPPPDDPYGITAQDLKDRLRDCIAANSDFAPYAFPQLLDKLDSTSMNTKRDSIQAMQACVSGYEANTINLYSITLWDALKFEILNVQEEDIAEEALKALGSIAEKFAASEGPLNAYLRPIIKECNQHLEDAPTKQSTAAGRILYRVSISDQRVASKVATGVVPTLFTLYQASDSIAKRRGLLEVYNEIVKAFVESQATASNFNSAALQTTASEALDAIVRALAKAPKAEVSFRLAALDSLARLVCVRGVLSEEGVVRAVGSVTDVILHERIDGHGDISAEAIKSLTAMASSVPEAVRTKAIPAFMVELADVPNENTNYAPALEALAKLSHEQQVFDTVVLRMKNKLNAARFQNAPREYQRALLLAILYAFTFGSPMLEYGNIRSNYYTEYAEPLILQIRDALPSERDDAMTIIVGRIANFILRPQTVHFQSTEYHKTLTWIAPAADAPSSSDGRLQHLSPFSMYFYASIRPEIAGPGDIVSLLRAQSRSLLSNTQESMFTTVLLRHVSVLVNKFLNPSTMQKSLADSHIDLDTLLSGKPTGQAISMSFAITKALLIQGKSGALASEYLKLLLEQIPVRDKAYARRFAGLLAPDEILTKENHCVVSALYKQRTFGQTVPPLVESVRSAEANIKPNYLIVLSSILRWLPYSIIEASLATLISPLLQTLDLQDAADQDVKLHALTVFESLLMHNPSVAAEHTTSLVTRLLNSTSASVDQARVRAKALQCLTLVPRQLKSEAVVPYRRQVVKKLLDCLDDARRNVRAEAVKCRSAWLALDDGKDDEE